MEDKNINKDNHSKFVVGVDTNVVIDLIFIMRQYEDFKSKKPNDITEDVDPIIYLKTYYNALYDKTKTKLIDEILQNDNAMKSVIKQMPALHDLNGKSQDEIRKALFNLNQIEISEFASRSIGSFSAKQRNNVLDDKKSLDTFARYQSACTMCEMQINGELEICISPTVQSELMAHVKGSKYLEKREGTFAFDLQEYASVMKYFSLLEIDPSKYKDIDKLTELYMLREKAYVNKPLTVGIVEDDIDAEHDSFYGTYNNDPKVPPKSDRSLLFQGVSRKEIKEENGRTYYAYYDIHGNRAVSSKPNLQNQYADPRLLAEYNVSGICTITNDISGFIRDYSMANFYNDSIRNHIKFCNEQAQYQNLPENKSLFPHGACATDALPYTPQEFIIMLKNEIEKQKFLQNDVSETVKRVQISSVDLSQNSKRINNFAQLSKS